jgi:hypothetical protein
MKSPIRFALRAGSTLAFYVVSHTAALATDTGPQHAADGADPAAATNGILVHQTKPYVLFMGADVTVQKDKDFDPIEEVTNSVIVTSSHGKPVNVALEHGVSLQVRENLKLSASGASISGLKTARAYSPAVDPFRTLEGFNSAASGANDIVDLARGQLLLDHEKLDATADGTGSSAIQAQQILAADQAAVDQATTEADHDIGMLPIAEAKVGATDSGGKYDAIRVSFAVTPKRDLPKAYVAVIAQIQDPADKSGQSKPWVHLQSLGAISAGETRKVNVYEEGMPSGYTLGKCEVHLYDGPNELATDISSKRVMLTEDEAMTFRVIEYVADNKGRSLPAVPATFVSDLRPSLSPAQLNQACYVRVAKDGKVAATFGDKDGTQPLQDPELDAALKGLRFKPAIESGKPVESIVAIRLGMITAP